MTLDVLIQNLRDPEVYREWVSEGLATVAVLLFAGLVYLLVSRSLRLAEATTHLTHAMVQSLRIIARWLFVGLTAAAVLQVWGVLDQFWAALTAVFALIAIGFFAVWSVLSNVLCSIILLASRPFRIGEQIDLPPDELGGEVVDITLLHTVLRTDEGHVLKVPNNLFFQRVLRVRAPGVPRLREAEAVDAED